MAYTPISSSAIAAGQPTTTGLFSTIKNDLDDHQSRITTLEAGGVVAYPPITLQVSGPYYLLGTLTNLVRTTINFNLQLTGAFVIADTAGSAGSLQVDVKYLRPSVSLSTWTSVFTTQPLVSYSAGNNAAGAGTLNPANVMLQAGDLLRLDVTSVQTGAKGFMVRLDFSKT